MGEIVGNIIGVFLGFILGIIYDRWARNKEEKKIEKIFLQRMFFEIEENINVAKNNLNQYRNNHENNKVQLLLRRLSNVAWNSLLTSGELRVIRNQTLIDMLIEYYNKVDYILYSENLMNYSSFSTSLKESIEKQRDELLLLQKVIIDQYDGDNINKNNGVIKQSERIMEYKKKIFKEK